MSSSHSWIFGFLTSSQDGESCFISHLRFIFIGQFSNVRSADRLLWRVWSGLMITKLSHDRSIWRLIFLWSRNNYSEIWRECSDFILRLFFCFFFWPWNRQRLFSWSCLCYFKEVITVCQGHKITWRLVNRQIWELYRSSHLNLS